MVESLLTTLGLTKATTVAGFFGSLLSLKLIGDLTPTQGIVTVIGGMLCAAYLSPMTIYEGWFNPKSEGAIAFLIGLLGMSIMAAIVKEVPSAITMVEEKYLK